MWYSRKSLRKAFLVLGIYILKHASYNHLTCSARGQKTCQQDSCMHI